MIIAFIGKMGSGKDEALNQLKLHGVDIHRLALGDFVKEMVQKAFKLTDEQIREKPPEVRKLLQVIGTDIIRDQVDKRFWIKRLRDKIFDDHALEMRLYSPAHHIGITDARFLNEIDFIKTYDGLVIRIDRPIFKNENKEALKHVSETELNNYIADITVQNFGTLDNFYYNLSKGLEDAMQKL